MTTPKDSTDAISRVSQSHHRHHHHHHTGRRVRAFFRPDGRKVHIAGSPHEVEQLRKTLSAIEKCEFDLVIHGSDEHIQALRESHDHHEKAMEDLREQHGEIFEEFERVIRQLDELSTELHNISEHAVQLDANFSKYGYSAHLRTKDSSPSHSSANSLYAETLTDPNHHDWEAEKSQGQLIQFWKKPVIRQYFHKGLLWRAQEAQEVASYELFIDLMYVGIIAISGDNAAEVATGKSLLRFLFTFLLSWKIWSDIAGLIGWFDADDVIRRITVLFHLACLLGFTTNMSESQEHTYTSLVSFYLASRLFTALFSLIHAYLIPMVRPVLIGNAIINALPATLWIGSIHVEWPGRYALLWTAAMLDVFGSVILQMFQRGLIWPWSSRLREFCKRTFEFTPGLSIEHKIERTNAFVTLIFGYSVVALLYQNGASFGVNAFFGKAVLGLVQAFAFNWLYFEMDSWNLHTHAIRRHYFSAIVWLMGHLPFIMAYVIAGAALSKLVLLHDCIDADPETLAEHYISRSEGEMTDGQRWFYCAGLSIALMGMCVISLSHVYKTIPGQRFVKWKRLTWRFIVAIIILLLPLAKSLNSLHLIATTTSLVILVLTFEIIGSMCVHESFWKSGNRRCTYNARCHVTKKELEASMKHGVVINVEEIAKRETGEQHV